MMKRLMAAAAAATLMVGVAGYAEKAEAALVSFYNDGVDDESLSSGLRFDVGCFSDAALTTMVDCFGALIDVSANNFDTNDANGLVGDMTDSSNVGMGGITPAEELAFVQTYVGDPTLDWTGAADTTDAGGAGMISFLSGAQYILFTVGLEPRVGLLRNDSGGAIYVDFEQIGQGAGLSHYAEFGGAPIPVPAALPLFLTAIAGLFGFRRFKRRAAA